jgi:hypothetical protein
LNGYLINESNDEWNHDIKNGMIPAEMVTTNMLKELEIIKIASMYTLENWNTVPEKLMNQYQLYLRILND